MLVDPGGEYAYRVSRLAVFAVAGPLLTALGIGIGIGIGPGPFDAAYRSHLPIAARELLPRCSGPRRGPSAIAQLKASAIPW